MPGQQSGPSLQTEPTVLLQPHFCVTVLQRPVQHCSAVVHA